MIKVLLAGFLAFGISFLSYAAAPDAMDSLCAATDKAAGFTSGDTIKWETKVLPEFKYVTTHPDFRKLAGDNYAYKLKLEALRVTPENIRQRNNSRIIEEARQSGFNKSLTSRIQCTRNFVEKKLPLAVDNFIGCLQPYNKKFCGTDFQSHEGIQKNLDVIKKVDKQFNQMITAAYSDPAQADFLEDLKDSYEKFALKVKEAGIEVEKAKQRELTENKNEYGRVTKKINGLEDAEKVFGRCRSYLKKEGFEDFENEKQILGQISDCALPGSPTEQTGFHQQMKSFEKVGEDLQRQSMVKLASDMYGFTLEHSKKSYLQSYYKVHGALPNMAAFQKATGKSPKDSEYYSAVVQEVKGTPVMDIPGEMNKFNDKVKLLNAACKDQSLAGGSRAKKVNEAYTQLLNRTAFGSLMTIKGFKKEIGTFDEKDCLNGNDGLKALTPDDKDKVKTALGAALDVLGDKGRRLVSDKAELLNPKDPYDGIRYFLKYNPLVVKKMISDNVDPAGAALLCYEIKKIYSDERSHDRWNTALSWASMAGAIVATVLTGGAAAPLMVAALTVGTVNSLNAMNYAYVAEQSYMESNVSGTYDRSIAEQQVTKYNTNLKMEGVGLVLNFVPMGAKALAKPMLKTAGGKLVSQGWRTSASMTAPMTRFMTKAASKAGASVDELLVAVAPKNASRYISKSLREFASGLPEDAAMEFATLTLAYPDPPGVYSEEGMTDLMMGVGMSRGMALIPSKLRDARFQKQYKERLGHARGYFDGLSGDQKNAFDEFKREVDFDKLAPDAQEEMLVRMHQIHKENNSTAGEKVKFGKVMDLAKFKQELIAKGVSPSVADKQVRNLASKENRVLGESPYAIYNDDNLASLQKEFKADESKRNKIKEDYGYLIARRDEIRMEAMGGKNPELKAEYKLLKQQTETMQWIHSDLLKMEADIKQKHKEDIDKRNAQQNEDLKIRQADEAAGKIAAENKQKEEFEQKAKAEETKRIAEFQEQNPSYLKVKSNYNATSFQYQSEQMMKNGVGPAPSEFTTFVSDMKAYREKDNIAWTDKQRAGERALNILSKNKNAQSTDKEAFQTLVAMMDDPRLSKKQVAEAMTNNFDYSKLKISDNQLAVMKTNGMDVDAIMKKQVDGANAYFDGLPKDKKKVMEKFKKDVGFEKFSSEQQAGLIVKMHNTHNYNNNSDGNVTFAKRRDLAEVKQVLQKLGVKESLADKQVRELASEKNKILGVTIPHVNTSKGKYVDYFYKGGELHSGLVIETLADGSLVVQNQNGDRHELTPREFKTVTQSNPSRFDVNKKSRARVSFLTNEYFKLNDEYKVLKDDYDKKLKILLDKKSEDFLHNGGGRLDIAQLKIEIGLQLKTEKGLMDAAQTKLDQLSKDIINERDNAAEYLFDGPASDKDYIDFEEIPKFKPVQTPLPAVKTEQKTKFKFTPVNLDKEATPAEINNVKGLIQRWRHMQENNIKGDLIVTSGSKKEAYKYVESFKPLKEYGFPNLNKSNWNKYYSTFDNSALKGLRTGYQVNLTDGSWARVRIDWDPTNNGHYNIEMRVPNSNNKMETVNVMVKFSCDSGPCSEQEVKKLAEKLQ